MIATGSLPQSLKIKMYYLCHELHTLLSAALHGLDVQQYFLEITENSCNKTLEALEQ